MIYVVYFILLTIIYLLSKTSKRMNYLYVYISIIIFGQRWNSGTDFPGYLKNFLNDFKSEYLYYTFQSFIKKNDFHFGILIFLIYSITIILFVKFINKIAEDSNEILYFFFLSEIHFAITSQMRNWIAIAFYLNAYLYYKLEKKKIKSLVMIILGSGFHKSIVYLIPFIVFDFKLTKKNKKIILVVALIISQLNLDFIFTFFKGFTYYHYFLSHHIEPLSMVNKIKFIILWSLYLIYFILKRKEVTNEKEILIEKSAYIYIVLYSIALNIGIFNRISFYFKIFELLYLFTYIKYTKIKNLKFIVYIYFYLYLLGCLLTNAYDYKNYKFERLRLYRDVPIEKYIEDSKWKS